jgi:L-alanine-DL-glutamate epimerase-like enolase superfamily enzyme
MPEVLPPSLLVAVPAVRIEALHAVALSVPLYEPFVIASGRVDATRAVLVRVELRELASGGRASGLGEAAALPPVTREDQPDVLAAIAALAVRAVGTELRDLAALERALDAWLPAQPVARAGVECALLDALARLCGMPLGVLLGGTLPCQLHSDITLPIAEPEHMAALAREHAARGFSAFKIKVGKQLEQDLLALAAVATAVPGARVRLDANAGFAAADALRLCAEARRLGVQLECFEQPCARGDLEGMAEVAAKAGVPVIADESVTTLADLDRVLAARAAQGVNLKLAKSGGLLPALAIGRAARAAGLELMCGGMVETRLGMTAMAHVACALNGADGSAAGTAVEYVDLDTAFLLASDPFEGGYQADGAELTLTGGPGLDLRERS